METIGWTANLNLVACALTCLVGLLILLIFLSLVRSRFVVGLTGIVMGISELWAARRQSPDEDDLMQEYHRSTGQTASAQSRVQEIRAKYDREFHGEDAGSASDPLLPPAEFDAVDYDEPNTRRHNREKLDYDDEMDAFFDDMQL